MDDADLGPSPGEPGLTRRGLLGAGAGAASLALSLTNAEVAAARTTKRRRRSHPAFPSTATFDFNRGWRFGGAFRAGSENPGYHDRRFAPVTLPHTVTPLSWGGWNPARWEGRWIYRKNFSSRTLPLGRTFVDFQGVMTNATVYLNGQQLGEHVGGYLPFSLELTDDLLDGDNLLAVVVDGLPLDVPPANASSYLGDSAIDYVQPAGIYREATLRVVPDAYISDVFARAAYVLTPQRELLVTTTVDSAARVHGPRPSVTVELLDGRRVIARQTSRIAVGSGTQRVVTRLHGLGDVKLWSPDSPKLYTVRVTLSGRSMPSHSVTVTTGFREAQWTVDGLYLNGERIQVFGLNRHQFYPYTGMAASPRMQARDAQLIRQQLNCNMVRCSHYPQSSDFLDECDRLGLMVFEETPGWQYVGDENFEAVLMQNVHDMIVRDRNRPSVVLWGTRPDETRDYPTLFAQARQLAYTLDGTRQTSGAMGHRTTTDWAEDVFAYDDYTASGGNAELLPPIPGVPYLVSEAVGAVDGPPLYRWIDSSAVLATQARLHAQVHQAAYATQAYSGVLGWCAIDYDSSIQYPGHVWENMRWPGVLDTFRVAKPGAAFYRSQVSPATTPVVLPAFYWDFGPSSPSTGPGPGSMLATNCDTLEIYVDGALTQTATPDRTDYPDLPYAPVVVDLTVDGTTLPLLTVVGYVAGKAVTTLNMAGNPSGDRLVAYLEDAAIVGDGIDSTRFTFRSVDAYGNQRPYPAGNVTLSQRGRAAELVGSNPFPLQLYGGVGSAFVRSYPGRSGSVRLQASHPTLGTATAVLTVTQAKTKFL